MMLIRQIKETDFPAIYHLVEQTGVGMTSFPKDRQLLDERLSLAYESFRKNASKPGHEYYLFVLEDSQTGQIVGCSAIEAGIGYNAPFYSYKLSKHTQICHSLNIRNDYELLSLVNDHQGKSELCSLFLLPDFRRNQNGLLLSKSRFLFIAEHPHRFSSKLMAEMRGVSDEQGLSPFWEHVGHHFFHMPFVDADRLTATTNKQFIADLMPKHPIYVKLLPPAAQAVIGKPHPSTAPALAILTQEGFRYNNYIDIFDAGPTIEALISDIKTIAASRILQIKTISDEVSCSHSYLLATTQCDFRASLGQIIINEPQNSCLISKEIAELLQVQLGDELRVAPLQINHFP